MTEIDSVHAISEDDVGVTQFAGDHEGFFGIIKQRYSDFLVNEIDSCGHELHLTDIKTLPSVPTTPNTSEVEQDVVTDTSLPDDIKKQIDQLIDLSKCDGYSNTDGPARRDFVCIIVTELNKKQRKAIHHLIQMKYPGLVSNTAEQDGQKVIKVSNGSASALHREQKRRLPRPARYYTHFLLYKENMDTMEAANRLACKLRIKTCDIGYAGTKDKRGKTVQLMSISKLSPERIAQAARCIYRVKVGNFSFSSHNIALGQLTGNHFKIVLREVGGSDDAIATAVHSVQQRGVLNYYGLQRFGTHAGHTHAVGRSLLRGDWQEAVATILKPSSSPSHDSKSQTLQSYVIGRLTAAEASAALARDRIKGVEEQLLRGLADHGTDLLAALNYVPRNTRTMYLYAYQAYLWNRLVSKRVHKYGLQVLPGDLICSKASHAAADIESVAVDLESTSNDVVGLEMGCTTNDAKSGENCVSSTKEELDEGRAVKSNRKQDRLHDLVRAVKEDEIDSIDISQVLIPAIGFAVRLPDNELADWYRAMLLEDGLTVDRLDHKQIGYSVCGAYRALLVKPKNFAYKICHYTDPLKPLVYSDVDIIESNEPGRTKLTDAVENNDVENKKPCETSSENTREHKTDQSHVVGTDADPSHVIGTDADPSHVVGTDADPSHVAGTDADPSHVVGTDADPSHVVGTDADPSHVIGTDADVTTDAEKIEDDSKVVNMKQDNSLSQQDTTASSELRETRDGTAASSNENIGEKCSAEGRVSDAATKDIVVATDKAMADVTPLKAVVVQFSLPSAAYATMVLRELMKMSTGAQFHAGLNTTRPAKCSNTAEVEMDDQSCKATNSSQGEHFNKWRESRGGRGRGGNNRGRGFGKVGHGEGIKRSRDQKKGEINSYGKRSFEGRHESNLNKKSKNC